MNQDVNKIIDNLNAEWAQDMATSKKRVAIFVEKIRVLEEENQQLKQELEQLKNENDNEGDDE
ncbi:hypothetical protein J8TS2_35680 [Lederbergia ruris]|uniref:Phage protein n=1 Tax=Lederbergia ruris TaxID=217495 RepID=A0ABQ4KP12_9BACI|nr:hypothetical protein [Lederbergia ruris]GIN59249.1 hypothetical protein J8TS2_35680 [Lederbergia ruris]